MLQRAVSGVIFVIILVSAILYNCFTFYILFLFLMFVAIFEFQKISTFKSYFFYILGATAYLTSEKSLALLNNLFYLKPSFLNKISNANTIEILLFFAFLITLFNQKSKNPFTELGAIFLTYIYSIVPFVCILAIPYLNDAGIYQGTTFLGCIILIWSTDTFAYLTGRAIGKHKLYPKISPNKTVEGSVGGILFTLITATILSCYFTQYSLIQWLGLSVIISIFGALGDLVESMFKRAANIKDSGNLIPGHGGVLDRFDSLLYAAPFIYFYLQLIS